MRLTVSEAASRQSTISIPDELATSWAAAIRFGYEVAIASLCGNEAAPPGLDVVVHDVVAQPVDTTAAAMAYVTFRAIANALDTELGNRFQFDESTGRFILV
jgi:hypothetical protein